MRRRRPFRRPSPRRVPAELRRANTLMEGEKYAEAASAFAHIANQAERRRGPRAPILHLRAGRAYAQARVPVKAMQHTRKGLGMIAARRDWAPLRRFGQRAIDELSELGYTKEAGEIKAYLASTLPENTPPRGSARKHVSLPTHCSGCGAPLRSDEVEWIDAKTAECIFCGNPVQGED